MRILVAPDKLRGTLDARQAARALAGGARRLGHPAVEVPLADGGEGTLDVLGGANRVLRVTGPLSVPVDAPWRLDAGVAVVEMALASGLVLAGGASSSDPIGATTRGTGELIAAAIAAGATAVMVGAGGSATTDGGAGAIEVLERLAPLGGAGAACQVEVACDVTTSFLDAAGQFAPQKGATPAQVDILRRRLEAQARDLFARFGVDVTDQPGSGAAGGLAGALLALGADLVPGFELVARHTGLAGRIAAADLVVTGEGRVDATSLAGKVVGGVSGLARAHGVPVGVVAGSIDPAAAAGAGWCGQVDLTATFGAERAFGAPEACLEEAMGILLGS